MVCGGVADKEHSLKLPEAVWAGAIAMCTGPLTSTIVTNTVYGYGSPLKSCTEAGS